MHELVEYLALAVVAIVATVVLSEWIRARRERAIYKETQRRKI